MKIERENLYWVLLGMFGPLGMSADGAVPTEITGTTVTVERIANPAPVVSFAAPVSLLVFEPSVDVQSRGFAEAQADVSIRGGTFEQTGFLLGPLTLLDPQTGHYFAEIPFSPRFLEGAEVLTGVENARRAFNSTAGSIAYQPGAVIDGGEVLVVGGDNALFRGEVFGGRTVETEWGRLGADLDLAHSQSDGTVENGDHRFERVSGRLQLSGESRQTDLLAGYQDKFFGWPNLYAAPFDSPESEDIETTTVYLGHRVAGFHDGAIELAAYYRRNVDDYDFNRFRPNAGNPFQHTTEVWGVGGEVSPEWNGIIWRGKAEAYLDSIESTTLTNTFQSRSYWKLGMVPEKVGSWGDGGDWVAKAGLTYADSNRDEGAVDAVADFEIGARLEETRWFLGVGYAGSSQVAGYTAIGSSPTGGLFRGNPDLGRETSDTVELRTGLERERDRVEATIFSRWDRDLVDWTFSQSATTSRTANPIDTDTVGLELLYQRELPLNGRTTLSYTWLHKDESYDVGVDASFYALNYPEHRVTWAWIQPLDFGFQLRVDTEWRQQRENLLRESDDTAILSYLSLSWRVPQWDRLTVIASVDNLFDDDFEEVPGTPGSGRQWAIGGKVDW